MAQRMLIFDYSRSVSPVLSSTDKLYLLNISSQYIIFAVRHNNSISTHPTISAEQLCRTDQFSCAVPQCTYYTHVCDFRDDCMDGSDEQICGECDFEVRTWLLGSIPQ